MLLFPAAPATLLEGRPNKNLKIGEESRMLSMKLLDHTSEEVRKTKALYYRAFPKNERRSFPELAENRLGGTEVFCFYDEDTFVGMACLLNSPSISHIIYLAVDESLRGHGYGSKALELLHHRKAGKKIMVDIEIPEEQAANAGQRKMRKKFYLRAGYQETPVKYEWRHENYEILSFGGQITEEEYDGFWEDLRKHTEP